MTFVLLVILFAFVAKQDSRFPCFVAANVPSSRTVYYLHTTPAHWTAANNTCTRYGGDLVRANDMEKLKADIQTLDDILDWHGAFSNLTSVWTGLHKVQVPPGGFMWSGCENFTASYLLPSTSTGNCFSMSKTFQLNPFDCESQLPYICQIEEGQCWFLPVEDHVFTDKGITFPNVDLNGCAKLCRNYINGTTNECWGFSADNNTCALHNHTKSHIFLREMNTYLLVSPSSTVYLKICTGGETTTMKPVPSDPKDQPEPENCTQPHQGEAWQEDGVCYCDCDQPPVILTAEYLSLSTDDKINKIVEELLVDSSNTSASFRKLNSIDDKRPSAQSIGALGIGVICVVFGGLVLLDMNRLISHFSTVFCKKEPPASSEQAKPQEAEMNL